MKRLALYFTQEGETELREEDVPPPNQGNVLVKTLVSGVSAGTEMLVLQHKIPKNLVIDQTIAALPGTFKYPLKYGYSTVGRIIELGQGIDKSWQDKLVFAFHPHESLFTATPEEIYCLPENVAPEDAVFFPNTETAVNFLMDGRPFIGERVVVFGQGIVGLLTTSLLAQVPLGKLVTVDKYPLRRSTSLEAGANLSLEPDICRQKIGDLFEGGADLVYELSGNPEALNQAINITGFNGRIVIGSWYGDKPVNLDLGGDFHRSRISLISSQVSTLSPDLTGRWNKARRYQIAWQMLGRIKPSRFITHRFDITKASKAYHPLKNNPGEVLQVIFTYKR